MLSKTFFLSLIFIISLIFYFQIKSKNKNEDISSNDNETYNLNLLENIKYVAKDADGNEYFIKAEKGEIDLNNSEIIFLKKLIL